MTKEPIRDYWDSCLFIAYLKNLPSERDRVDAVSWLFNEAKFGRRIIIISTFVLSEVRPHSSYDSDKIALIEDLFDTDRPFIQIVSVTRTIARQCRTICANFPDLTNPDGIHIATAIHQKVDNFFTFDGDRATKLKRSADLLQYDGKIGTPPLSISSPRATIGPLFDGTHKP